MAHGNQLTRANLRHCNAPKQFWSLSMSHAIYSRNHVISGQRKASAFELSTGEQCTLKHLRTFVLQHISNIGVKGTALADTAVAGIFVGYAASAPGWLFYNPITRKITTTNAATFDETKFTFMSNGEIRDNTGAIVTGPCGGTGPAATSRNMGYLL